MRVPNALAALAAASMLLLTACGDGTESAADGESQATTQGVQGDSPERSATERPTEWEPLAAGDVYVNLGDSFSSGAGVRPLVAQSPFRCQRTSLNFAHLIAEQRGLELTDVSCAAADTDDFYDEQFLGVAPQLDELTAVEDAAEGDVRLVTVMIGGNNSDTFSRTIRLCTQAAQQDPAGSPCRDTYGDSLLAPVRDSTYDEVVRALGDVADRAPSAQILLVGYPRLLPQEQGCYPRVGVAAGDVGFVRELENLLNDTLRRAAQASGVPFIDMAEVSAGHDACAPRGQRWVEPQLDADITVPLHPNTDGLSAIAEQILAAVD